jgi:histidine triad (HIT) family protein
MILRLVFWAASTRIGEILTGLVFEHFSVLLPVKRYYENKYLIAFQHPQAGYPVHILIVPKKAVSGMDELCYLDSSIFVSLFICVNHLVKDLGLRTGGYQLILNGGAFQVIPQLHFHFIAD